MLLENTVIMKWNSKNKKYYESKGYIFTKCKDEFEVKIKDLSHSSDVKIKCKCDNCGKISNITWVDYNKIVKDNNKTYCHKCSYSFNNDKTRISRLKNSISFKQWCINNNRQDLLNLWDFELNKYNPDEVSYSTTIKCYFKCKKQLHKSELKSINAITRNNDKNFICIICSSFGQWLLDNYGENGIKDYWSVNNIINPFEINYGSKKKILLICPNCKNEKLISPNDFRYKGISCSECSDGISFPEKFMFNLLKQLNTDFEYQLSHLIFEWCKDDKHKFKYDFYIPSLNCIIETHGRQHYENCNRPGARTAQEEQINDIFKEQLAKKNGINYYISIDCRYSSLKFIKNSILSSELSQLYNLSNINWLECQQFAYSSFIKTACELWNNKIQDTYLISKKLKLSRSSVIKYLKIGNKLNWCDYNSENQKLKGSISTSKKVYCIELDKIYSSINNAEKETGIPHINITNCCLLKNKSAGKHPVTGEKLHWIYYNK